MAEIKIFGYTDKISVKQGEKINFHVSADGTKTRQTRRINLWGGTQTPDFYKGFTIGFLHEFANKFDTGFCRRIGQL